MTVTSESFIKDVVDHEMTIENDNGVHRSLFFGVKGCGNKHFRIVTWPGHLAISGDMGDFIFARTPDMFNFFRNGGGYINKTYWGEKLKAVSTFGGYMKFDWSTAVDSLTDTLISCNEGIDDEDVKLKLNAVLRCTENDEFGFVEMVRNWDEDDTGLNLDPCDLYGTEKFTYQYVWCLRAIVWGIARYDHV